MPISASDTTFSIPFRYLWSTNFSGDLAELNERPSGLARFVGDHKNQLLRIFSDEHSIRLCQQMSHDSSRHWWPLVLFGPSGTGKTSLALALISEISDPQLAPDSESSSKLSSANSANQNSSGSKNRTPSRSNEKPVVLSAADFDRRFRAAIASDSVADFRRRMLRCSGLVIDDLQQIVDKSAAQNELLYLIDQRALRNRPLIFTMEQDPVRCDGLSPQLISRLSGGLCLPVHAPGRDALKTILLDLAQCHHLTLTDNAIALLLDRLQVTVPKILHFFSQLKMAVRTESMDDTKSQSLPVIDATFITRMFYRSESDRLKLAKLIIKHVAAEFHLKPTDIRSDSRKQSFVMARGISIWLIRKLLDLSFAKIGSLFGNRDHSTIMHAYRKTDQQLELSEDSLNSEFAASIRHTLDRLELKLSNLFASEIQFV